MSLVPSNRSQQALAPARRLRECLGSTKSCFLWRLCKGGSPAPAGLSCTHHYLADLESGLNCRDLVRRWRDGASVQFSSVHRRSSLTDPRGAIQATQPAAQSDLTPTKMARSCFGSRPLAGLLLLLASSWILSCSAVQFKNAVLALQRTPQLSKLYQACGVAGLLDDAGFAGRQWEATIFSPTNAAFDKFMQRKGVSWATWLQNKTEVRATLFHMIASDFGIKEPSQVLYNTQVLPSLLTRLSGRSKLTFGKVGGKLTIKGDGPTIATLSNVVIDAHKVKLILMDDVLSPDLKSRPLPLPGQTFKSIYEAISQLPGLETFKRVLDNDPEFKAYLSNPNLQGTFFVPTNKAVQFPIKTLGTTVEKFLDNKAYLGNLFKYHMMPGVTWDRAQFAKTGKLPPTLLNGHSLSLQLYHEHTVIASDYPSTPVVKGKMLLCFDQQRLEMMKVTTGKSWVTASVKRGSMDVVAGKARVHLIDHWLLYKP